MRGVQVVIRYLKQFFEENRFQVNVNDDYRFTVLKENTTIAKFFVGHWSLPGRYKKDNSCKNIAYFVTEGKIRTSKE